MKLTEDILYFAWQYGMFDRENLFTTKGEKVEVLSLGIRNTDSGPDFFGARIKIGSYIWAGNVEMHLKASDWFAHKHHINEAYKNVILHVVAEYDLNNSTHNYQLNTVILPVNRTLIEKYREFLSSKDFIPCARYVKNIHPFVKSHMITRTATERLESKSRKILEINQLNKGDWNQTFYTVTARYFGSPQNTDTFERLARTIPLKILGKHKNNLFQLEALLFGTAGLIPQIPVDKYTTALLKEWLFLQKKYKIPPLASHHWKFMRMRPANFPTIRMAQFAYLLHSSSSLFSKVIAAYSTSEIRKLFETSVSEYWHTHYTFGKSSTKKEKHTGKNFIDILMINAVAPLLFAYGTYTANNTYKDKAITILELTDAEHNHITQKYFHLNFPVKSALYSQGLLSLKFDYCNRHKCLYCMIGHQIIKTS